MVYLKLGIAAVLLILAISTSATTTFEPPATMALIEAPGQRP